MRSLLRHVVCLLALCGLAGSLVGCASIEGSFTTVGDGAAPRPADCHVDVYRLPPEQPYTVVSRLAVHVDGTHFAGNSLDQSMPELLRQACLSGAEAVTKLSIKPDSDTKGFTLTALGIRFTG